MLASWGATLAVITVRDLGLNIPGLKMNPACQGNRIGGLPAPADYLATFIVYMPLALMEGSGNAQVAKFASLFGWAWFLGVVALPCLGTSNPTGRQDSANGQSGTAKNTSVNGQSGTAKNTKTTGA